MITKTPTSDICAEDAISTFRSELIYDEQKLWGLAPWWCNNLFFNPNAEIGKRVTFDVDVEEVTLNDLGCERTGSTSQYHFIIIHRPDELKVSDEIKTRNILDVLSSPKLWDLIPVGYDYVGLCDSNDGVTFYITPIEPFIESERLHYPIPNDIRLHQGWYFNGDFYHPIAGLWDGSNLGISADKIKKFLRSNNVDKFPCDTWKELIVKRPNKQGE